ncbi:hypothetical protein Leryth_026319 [Lithospermum erythrorhizon]|uniref:Serine protease n=1 Tax=Lithospermum erythrorhizon TaxID=34254 RepID=A0AAV3P1H7_LITER|nr:hypothetical protein Leryth_026319 [Lithospermum erythrorhizon]
MWMINICACFLTTWHFQLFLLTLSPKDVNGETHKDFYIAFLRDHPVDEKLTHLKHRDMLSNLKASELDAKESLVYSYTKSFNAFAAKLSADEARKLSSLDGVLHVFRNQYHKLHTTRSWDFIGLPTTAKRNLKLESNIIVGLFDTGITPQSESFEDHGLDQPPAKWKGTCVHFANFSGCNKKLIGATYFKLDRSPDPYDTLSPIDVDGHGTHTSSTLAGSFVPDANLFGLARGTARGAVPSARIAVYKVCWASSGCADMDILAAFEAAIHDGVDVISISIGGFSGDYTSDAIAVGSFHATIKGIITVASAGNDGPSLGSVANHAPWLITVAASGIDRDFRSKIVLGSGQSVYGVGVNTFESKAQLYPLLSGIDAAKNSESKDSSRFCDEESLDPEKVKGKILFCELGSWGADSVVKGLGGIGTIIQSDFYLDTPQIYMAPSTMVNSTTGEAVTHYINSTRLPSANIHRSEEVKIRAPFVGSFSSRGPNPGTKHLLKPDIAAPGIDILASYTPLKSLTGLEGDTLFSMFTFMSGTSMACPHVAGAAAYVRSFHPEWSPAAVRSAIITTATPMSCMEEKHAEFAYGAGQVNPTRAISPGLIYDMDSLSYIQFLCNEGYNSSTFSSLIGPDSINCSKLLPTQSQDGLNYPTMQLSLKSDKEPTTGIFRRRVTNVGPPKCTYNASITAPKGVQIRVKPMSLCFSHVSQRRRFKILVKAKPMPGTPILSASITWKAPGRVVRSPIVIYNPMALSL